MICSDIIDGIFFQKEMANILKEIGFEDVKTIRYIGDNEEKIIASKEGIHIEASDSDSMIYRVCGEERMGIFMIDFKESPNGGYLYSPPQLVVKTLIDALSEHSDSNKDVIDMSFDIDRLNHLAEVSNTELPLKARHCYEISY